MLICRSTWDNGQCRITLAVEALTVRISQHNLRGNCFGTANGFRIFPFYVSVVVVVSTL
jgi:hypothetical protein